MIGETKSRNVSSIRFRPASSADEAFLYKLYCSTRAEEMEAAGWTAEQQEIFLRMQFNAQQTHYRNYFADAEHRIVLIGGKPAGRMVVLNKDEEIRFVDISLLAEYRNRGVGTSLIKDLLAESDRVGKPVRLHVVKFNRARRLYERLGFSIIGDAGSHFLMERPASRD